MTVDSFNAIICKTRIAGRSGPLAGLRITVKDNMDVDGERTTACSKILLDNTARKNAAIVSSVLKLGAEIVGKTNMHEFAFGATTTSTVFGPARNPLDLKRICGGSSGGAAASVAANLADAALGTDTGGSVRLPAAFCGVVGFKPTYGLLSMDGIIPLSRTLDTVGIMAKSVKTVIRIFSSLTGQKRMDCGRVKAGLMFFGNDDISRAILEKLRHIDARRISIPAVERVEEHRRIVASVEAFRYHERWLCERQEDYFPDVRDRLLFGKRNEKKYADALNRINEAREALDENAKEYSVIISPTVTESAPEISEVSGKELHYSRLLSITSVFNAARSPSVSVPVAMVDGMPVSMMISTGTGRDMELLEIASRFDFT